MSFANTIQRCFILLCLLVTASGAYGQITSPSPSHEDLGDGVLNAPYRGTINSLREACMDVAYGETRNLVFPEAPDLQLHYYSGSNDDFEIWVETDASHLPWDRSVIRLYCGIDGSGQEVDLTGTSSTNRRVVNPRFRTLPDGTRKTGFFSLRAIGTKVLCPQSFRLKFSYRTQSLDDTGFLSTEQSTPIEVKVAPMTGSFGRVSLESEAYHYGTTVLDVAVGNARLTVPIGCATDMIGAVFLDCEWYGPLNTKTFEMVFPGAAESVFIAHETQFRNGGFDYKKLTYGIPWPGYLIGWYCSTDIYGSDGTWYDIDQGAAAQGYNSVKKIRRVGIDDNDTPYVQKYEYDTNNDRRVNTIYDRSSSSSPNWISLTRDPVTGCVTAVTTSDGRAWTILSNADKQITGVVPQNGKGARYYEWSDSFENGGRVRQVRATDRVLYEYLYQPDGKYKGDLIEEKHNIDGTMQKVVEHAYDGENRIRKEYLSNGEFRKYFFEYGDPNSNSHTLAHRLKAITSYSGFNDGGTTAYTTKYDFAITPLSGDAPLGNTAEIGVLKSITLPDTSMILYGYDNNLPGYSWYQDHFCMPNRPDQSTVNVGIRTWSERFKGDQQQSIATYDVTYDFIYTSDTGSKLFYSPRIISQRDGQCNETIYAYEPGGQDGGGIKVDLYGAETNIHAYTAVIDGVPGEESNQLWLRQGPKIKNYDENGNGTGTDRTPVTQYFYYTSGLKKGLLEKEVVQLDANDTTRVTTYEYDNLRRLISKTVDPGTGDGRLNLATQYKTIDHEITRDTLVRDPDGYVTRTQYEYDGQVKSITRYLTSVGSILDNTLPAFGSSYCTVNEYHTCGWLERTIVDNKDQAGTSLTPATITTKYTRDPLGRVTQVLVDENGVQAETNTRYNYQNQVCREYDKSGRGVERSYNSRGLLSAETVLAEGPNPVSTLMTSYLYDQNGNLYQTKYSTGVTLEKLYDGYGRLRSETRWPVGSGSVSSQDYDGVFTTYEYDNDNHVIRTYINEIRTDNNVQAYVDLSDTTAKYDESGFCYETRQRLVAGMDTDNGTDPVTSMPIRDPITRRRIDLTADPAQDPAGTASKLIETSIGDNVTSGGNRVITTAYDLAGRVLSVRNSAGGETQYVRDKRGNVRQEKVRLEGTKIADSYYAVTEHEYDALGRVIKTTDPLDNYKSGNRHYRTMAYDSRGNLLRETEFNSSGTPRKKTLYQYDGAGRKKQEAVLANPSLETVDVTKDRVNGWRYYPDGRLQYHDTYNKKDATPRQTEYTYDDEGRIDQIKNLTTNDYSDDEYMSNGQLFTRTVHEGSQPNQTHTYYYDNYGRVKQLNDNAYPQQAVNTKFEYDGLDRQVLVTQDSNGPLAQATKIVYDLAGRRAQYIEDYADPEKNTTRKTVYAYNSLGQMIAEIVYNKSNDNGTLPSQTTRYRYDSMGRTKRIVYPGDPNPEADICTVCEKKEYDAAGRMISNTNRDGKVFNHKYADRGNWLSKSPAPTKNTSSRAMGTVLSLESVVTNDLGQPVAITRTDSNGTSEIEFEYEDGLGYVKREKQKTPGATLFRDVAYETDQAGNRTKITYPGGTVLNIVPTAFNTVEQIKLGDRLLAEYGYAGRRPISRITTTSNNAADTKYKTEWLYDGRHRVMNITNSVLINNAAQTIAKYSFSHDGNDNVLSQIVDNQSRSEFASDSRIYTVDGLGRLTGVQYGLFSGPTETTVLDAVGNRESFTDRYGRQTTYNVNVLTNQYDSITENGTARTISWDAAGNLKTDEYDRIYYYDEKNRLTTVTDAAGNQLANYAYDGLGRRISSTIGGATTRYYYDGRSVIEERDAGDNLVRYHVNGPQYADERVVTTTASSESTYYLLGNNYSVIATANADGSKITSQNFSATGEFAGGGVDFDRDNDVDNDDLTAMKGCVSGPDIPYAAGCEAKDLDRDGDVDAADLVRFQVCMSGSAHTPPAGCASCTPASGTFAMHGRAVDVITDTLSNSELVLQNFRAREYSPKLGRWLQPDPKGYVDGPNLYEAFGGNATKNLDPEGEGIITWMLGLGYNASDSEYLGHVVDELHRQNVAPIQARAEQRFLLLYIAQQSGDPLLQSDADILTAGVLLSLGDILPSGKFAEAATGIGTGYSEGAGTAINTRNRVVRGGIASAETVLWAVCSKQGGQTVQNWLGGSAAIQAAEVRFFSATNGGMRLGLLGSDGFLLAASNNAGLLSATARHEALVQTFNAGLDSGIMNLAGPASLTVRPIVWSTESINPISAVSQRIVSSGAQRLIAQSSDDVLLGIVDNTGNVHLFRAGGPGTGLPMGHSDLVSQGLVPNGSQGFSIHVSNGKVKVVVRNSALNSADADFNLPMTVTQKILDELRVADDVIVVGN